MLFRSTTSDLSTSEGAVEAALGKIALKDAFTASLSDVDGSETLSLVVTGLKADFDLQGGTLLGGEGEARKWSITKDDYDSGAASIVVKPNYFFPNAGSFSSAPCRASSFRRSIRRC